MGLNKNKKVVQSCFKLNREGLARNQLGPGPLGIRGLTTWETSAQEVVVQGKSPLEEGWIGGADLLEVLPLISF